MLQSSLMSTAGYGWRGGEIRRRYMYSAVSYCTGSAEHLLKLVSTPPGKAVQEGQKRLKKK